MYPLTFLPFVGNNYSTGGIFRKRIMVMGDSHYGSVPSHDITQQVMAWYLDPTVEREGWMNTFLKFERSLVGHETSQAETQQIWQSVIFYNYLQVLLSGPREAGTDRQYKDSSAAFYHMLNNYQPDTLIVWGKRVWQKLPWEGWTEGETIYVDDYPIDNGTYTLLNGHRVRVVCVYHPSVGYSWDYWHRVISRFL